MILNRFIPKFQFINRFFLNRTKFYRFSLKVAVTDMCQSNFYFYINYLKIFLKKFTFYLLLRVYNNTAIYLINVFKFILVLDSLSKTLIDVISHSCF